MPYQASGTLVAHTKGTASLGAIKRLLDIVLEYTGSAVVCEALAQFDDSNKESSLGQFLSHMSERPPLFSSGDLTTIFVIGDRLRGRLMADGLLLVRDSILLNGEWHRLMLWCCDRLELTAGNVGLLVNSVGGIQLLVQPAGSSAASFSEPKAYANTYWSASVK